MQYAIYGLIILASLISWIAFLVILS